VDSACLCWSQNPLIKLCVVPLFGLQMQKVEDQTRRAGRRERGSISTAYLRRLPRELMRLHRCQLKLRRLRGPHSRLEGPTFCIALIRAGRSTSTTRSNIWRPSAARMSSSARSQAWGSASLALGHVVTGSTVKQPTHHRRRLPSTSPATITICARFSGT
jgi:hypothetical protein